MKSPVEYVFLRSLPDSEPADRTCPRKQAGFYLDVFGDAVPLRSLLSYQVSFSPKFDFVLGRRIRSLPARLPLTVARETGGKLPGLYGGDHSGGCSGGRNSDFCFSLRVLWRAAGAGESRSSPVPRSLCAELIFNAHRSLRLPRRQLHWILSIFSRFLQQGRVRYLSRPRYVELLSLGDWGLVHGGRIRRPQLGSGCQRCRNRQSKRLHLHLLQSLGSGCYPRISKEGGRLSHQVRSRIFTAALLNVLWRGHTRVR